MIKTIFEKLVLIFEENDLLNIFCVLSNDFISSSLFVNTR